MANKMRNIGI